MKSLSLINSFFFVHYFIVFPIGRRRYRSLNNLFKVVNNIPPYLTNGRNIPFKISLKSSIYSRSFNRYSVLIIHFPLGIQEAFNGAKSKIERMSLIEKLRHN